MTRNLRTPCTTAPETTLGLVVQRRSWGTAEWLTLFNRVKLGLGFRAETKTHTLKPETPLSQNSGALLGGCLRMLLLLKLCTEVSPCGGFRVHGLYGPAEP